ncbi:MAG: M50 family metallopeptidase [Kofleriaceae bacterium]
MAADPPAPDDGRVADDVDDADDGRGDSPVAGRAWALALLASLVLWHLPLGGVVLYPFKLLSTWTHELSHAVVMTVTGAGFDRMEIFRDGSGLAYAHASLAGIGGAAIAASGYMGASTFGAVVLALASTARRARLALLGLGVVLAASAALAIGNRFGQGTIAAMAVPVLAVAVLAPPRWVIAAAQLLAAQACVNAVLDIRVLFRPQLVVDGMAVGSSDAHAMAQATLGTSAPWAVSLWAGAWLAWSLGLLYIALRHVRRRPAPTP